MVTVWETIEVVTEAGEGSRPASKPSMAVTHVGQCVLGTSNTVSIRDGRELFSRADIVDVAKWAVCSDS